MEKEPPTFWPGSSIVGPPSAPRAVVGPAPLVQAPLPAGDEEALQRALAELPLLGASPSGGRGSGDELAAVLVVDGELEI